MTNGGNKILVLEKDQKDNLVGRLYDCGFTPVLRESLQQALKKFREGDIRAVIIRRENEFIDPLQFVLSLGKMDLRTPIIIIGEADDEYRRKMQESRDNVYFVTEKEDFHDCLHEIIDNSPGEIADA